MFRGAQRTRIGIEIVYPTPLEANMGAPIAPSMPTALASSWLIFGNLVEDRLPRLLLLVNERRGFGG
jgi:hypothetical protein